MNPVPVRTPDDADRPPRPVAVRRIVSLSLGMLLLGVAAGLLWLQLADPARWEVRSDGIVLTEAAARGQFSVVVVFVLIGVIASLIWGWVATWMLADLGWLLVPLVIVLTTLAAVLAWRIGVELGPPPPATVAGVSVGDRLPSPLVVDGIAAFLVWPMAGLVGVVGATWSGARSRD
jgi:hypothetical protein